MDFSAELLEGLEGSRRTRCERRRAPLRVIVVHELRVEDLVRRREVVLVLAHLHEVRHHPLVVFDSTVALD
jgi:hypothetical protein